MGRRRGLEEWKELSESRRKAQGLVQWQKETTESEEEVSRTLSLTGD